MESHIHTSCVNAQPVQFSLLWRAGPQELHVLLLMHSPEARGGEMKPALIQAEVYSKPVKQVARNCRCTHAHKFASAFPHTRKDTCISPMYARVFVLSAPPPLWIGGLYGPVGRGLFAPKCCFSPHYCQGIHR